MVTGLDVAENIRASGAGRKMFLDIPFYRTGVFAQNPPALVKGRLIP